MMGINSKIYASKNHIQQKFLEIQGLKNLKDTLYILVHFTNVGFRQNRKNTLGSISDLQVGHCHLLLNRPCRNLHDCLKIFK